MKKYHVFHHMEGQRKHNHNAVLGMTKINK
jgi:hypothetical protein